ncbi:MAG: radical SAM family heme chaperone HemW [Rickettsiales bacterium]|jgi:oxygen-independent coproporphyrinogen-3 oxidase|nr:radical SAM family heme chaperone HemW [Rickettsiales bacterium]
MKENISLYIHYPFCRSKCPYCDFNSYRVDGFNVSEFLEAYLREISHYSEILGGRTVDTVFFGGGTPSLASVEFLGIILDWIGKLFRLNDGAEISLEANPTTFEIGKFREFRSIGINRLSIGIQSLNDRSLEFLGRTYSRIEALAAIDMAQKCFGGNYSIDMIYARPGQKIQGWLEELEEAATLSPNHLSLYQLTIEPGTEFHRRGVRPPEGDGAARMYEITGEFLDSRGIPLYEISNYARGGHECLHNLNYWNSGEWLGIGAGAHSRLCLCDTFVDAQRERTAMVNLKNPVEWQRSAMEYGHGRETLACLTKKETVEEILLMGLRLRNGIKIDNVKKYLALESGSLRELLADGYGYLVDGNYIEVSDNNIRVPVEYLRILDSIVERL